MWENILWTVAILVILAIISGLGLGFANKYLEVKEDNRIDDVEKLLPGYNCGSCGFPGCRGFASAVVNGENDKLSKCKPGKKDKNFDAIIDYLKNHPNNDGSEIKVEI